MHQSRTEAQHWGVLETETMMRLHHTIKAQKPTPEPEGTLIIDQAAAKEFLGL